MSRHGKHLLPRTAILAIVAGVAVVALAGFFVVAQATDSSAFCMTCHEMGPYYHAWAVGPHKNVACVDCHVGSGTVNRLAHKFIALGEVRAHFFGDTKFPMTGVTVPNDRCLPCHRDVKVPTPAISRFSHELHATKASCWECHATAGHNVSLQALKAVGALAPSAQPATAAVAGTRNGRPITGHIRTTCLRCHDQSRMACATCHKAPHKDRGGCQLCHRPGSAFAFVHPSGGACEKCHAKPAKHVATSVGCATCHHDTGKDWKFAHPSDGNCSGCHSKPAKHVSTAASCPTCHRNTGKTWAFTHPSRKGCRACHTPPANHFGANCAACHHVGTPFARATFNHPPTAHGYLSRPCVKCHPNGPPAVSCTCHGGGTTGPGD